MRSFNYAKPLSLLIVSRTNVEACLLFEIRSGVCKENLDRVSCLLKIYISVFRNFLKMLVGLPDIQRQFPVPRKGKGRKGVKCSLAGRAL